MDQALLQALNAARAEAQPVVLVTDTSDGAQRLMRPDGPAEGGLPWDATLEAAARSALQSDRASTVETPEGRRCLVQPFNPPLRMLIVGAVHISQALAPMAAIAGHQVIVIDPRGAWSTPERFPNIELNQDWPDEAMEALKPDSRTSVVTLTHDPKLDDPALIHALSSPAYYVGALGSRKTHAARGTRLVNAGLIEEQVGRIAAPIGLDIGASSPAEIAVSILAEVTLALRGSKASRKAAEAAQAAAATPGA
ncbi:MAG: XdhC family protein [Rhodospirillaceae bacterium]